MKSGGQIIIDILYHKYYMYFKNLKTFGERSFSNAAPEVWNKLPEYIVFPIYCYL